MLPNPNMFNTQQSTMDINPSPRQNLLPPPPQQQQSLPNLNNPIQPQNPKSNFLFYLIF